MTGKKETLRRFLIGGLCGLALMLASACFLEVLAAGIRGVFHTPALVSHGAEARFGSFPLALLVQSVLMFALGGMAGIATMPFAEEGKTLLKNSGLHFLITAFFFSLLVVSCFDVSLPALPVWLGILLALYLTIWLGRWMGWYLELLDFRNVLGLVAKPSPLKWKETLLYLPFLLLLCVGLPILARLCDPADFPVFSGLFFPYLILPVGGFFSGLSLGKRQGLCPLYPALAFLLYLPMVFLLYNSSAMFHCFIAAGTALLGNTLSTLKRRVNRHA